MGKSKVEAPAIHGRCEAANSIPRTECELRQQGARQQDRELGTNCLERISGNQLRDGERGDRKSGRA
eukprot:4016017-Pleurochrysis_carterae.AAC.1